MTDQTPAEERRARGLATFAEVYGDGIVPKPLPGAASFFDLIVIDQQFSEVWSRTALSIPARRLLTIGILTAAGRFDPLFIQFRRALQTGELSIEQVREVVIHLVSYVGTPSSGDLLRVSEAAIAAHIEAGEAIGDGEATGAGETTEDGEATGAGETTEDGEATGAGETTEKG
jgi:4-carboxymuconolactone decarboxylase